MLIAIDYDQTFTEDPEFWCAVIALGIRLGHRFVCVTARHEPPDPEREARLPAGLPIVCTSGELKHPAAMRAGYLVNVWVDDMPGVIKGSQVLNFGPSENDLGMIKAMVREHDGTLTDDQLAHKLWDFIRGEE